MYVVTHIVHLVYLEQILLLQNSHYLIEGRTCSLLSLVREPYEVLELIDTAL